MISASPDGDRIRTFFSLLLERYSMAWAITFVSASSWFDESVSKSNISMLLSLLQTSSLEIRISSL